MDIPDTLRRMRRWRTDQGPDMFGRSLSPYPEGRDFAFTLIHDADSAYSQRLAPLFDAFDDLGMPLTVTVFPFWAAWARNGAIWDEWNLAPLDQRPFKPIAVPLEDARESAFYLDLADRGHEIALHTPSETSSTREEVRIAFGFFAEMFGQEPRMYVEHSAGNKLDAFAQQGNVAGSPYYNADLLRDSGSWIWLDRKGSLTPRDRIYYDLLGQPGAPWDTRARQQFSIERAFLRNSAGDGGERFLRFYHREVLDDLARRRGTVLLYTHLDDGWLDPRSFAMQAQIRDNLEHLASLNGWFVCGSDILDRFEAMSAIRWSSTEHQVLLVNEGHRPIDGLTLLTHPYPLTSAIPPGFADPPRDKLVLDRIGRGEWLLLELRGDCGTAPLLISN